MDVVNVVNRDSKFSTRLRYYAFDYDLLFKCIVDLAFNWWWALCTFVVASILF